jgi:hypothetical protein
MNMDDKNFNRARAKERITRMLALLKGEGDSLLSLYEVKDILKPVSESYQGIKTIPISQIVGSEGRYKDFNSKFLPKHSKMRTRWSKVDAAFRHDVILPPLKLYEIGGVYFVRDGNHRVSVAKSRKVEFIDAEVTSLGTQVQLTPDMDMEDIKRAVIDFEKDRFYEHTGIRNKRPNCDLTFTAPGRYDDILTQIKTHKYLLEQEMGNEITFEEAMLSCYDTMYLPIVNIIRDEKILKYFPGRTESDIYVWIVRHWDELKKKYGEKYPIINAARDLRNRFGKRLLKKFKNNV